MYLCSQFRRRIRKLQEMCNVVSLVSSVISVKHLVEEQCFSKPSSTLETCSVDISVQQFLVGCTHYQHLCLYLNKPTIRGLRL